MAVKYTSKDGAVRIECDLKAQPRLAEWMRDDLMGQLHMEWREFLEEVAVAVRNIKPGERVELYSKPIPVVIEADEARTDAAPSEGSREKP